MLPSKADTTPELPNRRRRPRVKQSCKNASPEEKSDPYDPPCLEDQAATYFVSIKLLPKLHYRAKTESVNRYSPLLPSISAWRGAGPPLKFGIKSVPNPK